MIPLILEMIVLTYLEHVKYKKIDNLIYKDII